jgi:hypothetical protein
MITTIVVIAVMTEVTIKKDRTTDRMATGIVMIKSPTEVVAAMIVITVVIAGMIKEDLTSHTATKEDPLIKRVPTRSLSEVTTKVHIGRGMKGQIKSAIQKRLRFGSKEKDSIKESPKFPYK